jgi:uncharacterized protein (DUF302 family)
MEAQTALAYGTEIQVDLSFAEAKEHVKQVFKEFGFGALTEVDVQGAMKEKINQNMEPYQILGMCNPNLAFQALQKEPQIGLMLPCNVVIRQSQGKVFISAQDPLAMMGSVGNMGLEPIGQEAKAKIDAAMARLSGQ